MTDDHSSSDADAAAPAITLAVAPPEDLELDLLALRRWRLEWTEDLQAAIDASLPELRPFMPWATDDHGLEQSREYIARSVAEWDRHESFNYAILARPGEGSDGGEVVIGSCGLMTRMGIGVLEIGYWVRTADTGRGYASAVARALADAALALPGINRAAIKHDPANGASGRVAEKAGFTHVGEIAHEPTAPGETGVHWIWELRG
ncbi:MAG TPA: GNAT family N-acetyltransferase [Nocardioidaceae bacterium]|nr:GNAT family N-acetyltransferase [Nocardioidaceae bacterium]